MSFPDLEPTGPILTAPPNDLHRPGGEGNWTSALVDGFQFLVGPIPRYGWVSVFDPDDEFDGNPATVITGTVVSDPHTSHADLQFVHPFGNDFEFHVAPDPEHFEFVGPTMEHAYLESTNAANTEFGLNVPGVIGMEWDRGLVQPDYRPARGDRVCLYGRLIIDAAHRDFHTEIHPPLVMASARATRSTDQPANSATFDATTVKVITRPYLVSQEFDHGGLFDQLAIQIGETEIPVVGAFTQIDAHPRLMPRPFSGFHAATFDIRPPSPRRAAGDRLMLDTVITQRSGGVGLIVIQHPEVADALRVVILLNENGYVVPPEPPRHDRTVSLDELLDINEDWAIALKQVLFTAVVLAQPHMIVVTERGFPSRIFEDPHPIHREEHENSRTRQPVTDLPGVTTHIDDDQQYPLFGTLTLEWQRQVGPVGPLDDPDVSEEPGSTRPAGPPIHGPLDPSSSGSPKAP